MIQDLHSHTYYSFCGVDTPEQVVETAIAGGIQLLGITDHAHGIGCGRTDVFKSTSSDIIEDYQRTLRRYFDHINLIKEKYSKDIKILRGIEIATVKSGRIPLPDNADVSFFDYCLVENLDVDSITEGDIFAFAERCGCRTGIAHTDLFAHIARLGQNPFEYLKKMAENDIFWEMNVNLDTIHGGRVHSYMLEFFSNQAQQDIVRESGVCLSVGFDGHRVHDYKPERINEYCRKISDMGIPMVFEGEDV